MVLFVFTPSDGITTSNYKLAKQIYGPLSYQADAPQVPPTWTLFYQGTVVGVLQLPLAYHRSTPDNHQTGSLEHKT